MMAAIATAGRQCGEQSGGKQRGGKNAGGAAQFEFGAHDDVPGWLKVRALSPNILTTAQSMPIFRMSRR
jgi:hypothetical protein